MPAETVIVPETKLRDQRVMVGHRTHTTPEEVEEAWQVWATTHGFAIRRRFGDYTTDLHHSKKRLQAYVSGGNWTADCPNCNGGVPTAPGFNDRGCCLDCGTVYSIEYPAPTKIAEAREALLARADLVHRNWFPHKGETPEDLRHENIVHGEALSAERQAVSDDVLLAEFIAREGAEGISMLRGQGLLGPTDAIAAALRG